MPLRDMTNPYDSTIGFIDGCNKLENNCVRAMKRIANEQDCYEAMSNSDYWETRCAEDGDVAALDLLRKTVWEAIEAYDKKYYKSCLNRLANSGAIIRKMMGIVSNEYKALFYDGCHF